MNRRRRIVAVFSIVGCCFVCWPAAAQTLDEVVAGAAKLRTAFLESALSISDKALAEAVGRPELRQRLIDALFDDANPDPLTTPAWIRLMAWDGGALLSSDRLLALWNSRKATIGAALGALEPADRESLHGRIAEARRALDDYRVDRGGIRSAFLELGDAYALCSGKHDANTQTLKFASWRLGQRAGELGDAVGALALADRLWRAGGYRLLSAALVVAGDIEAATRAPQPSQPANPAPSLEGKAVSDLR